MGFWDTVGKVASGIGKAASVASNILPKVTQGIKGVANIANAYKSGTGQREAISGFVGDMFGSKWGKIANTAIGAGEQIFKTGKSVVASSKGFKSNPLGTIQNIASGVGKIGNILGGATSSISSSLGPGVSNTKVGRMVNQVSSSLAPAVSGIRNVASATSSAYNQLKNPVSDTMRAGASAISSLRSAFRR